MYLPNNIYTVHLMMILFCGLATFTSLPNLMCTNTNYNIKQFTSILSCSPNYISANLHFMFQFTKLNVHQIYYIFSKLVLYWDMAAYWFTICIVHILKLNFAVTIVKIYSQFSSRIHLISNSRTIHLPSLNFCSSSVLPMALAA